MRKDHTPKIKKKDKIQDIEFEIAFYEGIIKDAPDFIEALTMLGDLYTKAGQWQKGLEVDMKLASLRPQDALVHYNLACSYSLLNQPKLALKALTKAFELGYDDFNHLKTDDDLANLLKDPHVREYIDTIAKKKGKT